MEAAGLEKIALGVSEEDVVDFFTGERFRQEVEERNGHFNLYCGAVCNQAYQLALHNAQRKVEESFEEIETVKALEIGLSAGLNQISDTFNVLYNLQKKGFGNERAIRAHYQALESAVEFTNELLENKERYETLVPDIGKAINKTIQGFAILWTLLSPETRDEFFEEANMYDFRDKSTIEEVKERWTNRYLSHIRD